MNILAVSLPVFCNQPMMTTPALNASSIATNSLGIFGRCDFDGRGGCWIENGKRNKFAALTNAKASKKRRLSVSPLASSTLADSPNSSRANFYKEVLKVAREKFTQETSFPSKDKDISLAKVLLYVAAEDEALMSFNRERDALSLQKERRETSSPSDVSWENVEEMPLAGKSMNQWLSELDSIAKEVEAELVTRDIGCHLVEVLEAVNMVLFESRGFKRSPILLDSNCAYLHTVLNSGSCSAILLSVIYIEVCRRLNLTIVGSRVGEDFLIWPPAGNPEELFRVTSGLSLFGVVNGKCVDDPRSKASDITSNSLEALEIATNRDIIGIALANLIRFYWKRASRSNHGLMLTSPLRPANFTDERITIDCTNLPLLRPQDLR
ncbi:OLC1v1030894C4 [Oldenlandia corymbosa var. corymbosa]|nr:OLC1v1030894C4 [Oldenlandia corymbosa var. corymbosa]